MHRRTFVPRTLYSVFVALAFLAWALCVRAQEQPPAGVLILQVGATKKVGMSTNALLANVAVENPKICRVQTLIEDPRAVLITGLNAGATRVSLTDDKKQSESFEVRVLADEETVREQQRKDLTELIRKAVPTASVVVIASPNNTVTLTGFVANPQTVQVIAELARSVFGINANVVNNLQIGGVQQVQIEVTVANVNRSEARNIGFSFLEGGKKHFLASTVAGAGSLVSSNIANILSPTAALTAAPNAVFGIIGDKQGFVGFLTALRTEGLAKIYSEPYVMTLSGRPGYIVSGGETPILTTSGTGAPNVTYKQFGTVVNFLPIVMANGKIHLEVRPEISNINAASGINIPSAVGVTSVPGFDIRSVQVAVQLQDGQTLAIGGLIQNRVNATANKVPVLGDLPFLGAAFSQKQYTENEEELIILVTPRLVHPLDCHHIPKYLPGRETRSPDDFELFLEGILEAPRGPRSIFFRPYTAAHKTGPTAGVYPCADGSCGTSIGHGRCLGRCGIRGGCNGGCCGEQPVLSGPGHINAQLATPVTTTLPAAKLPVDGGDIKLEVEGETPVTPPIRNNPRTEPLPQVPPMNLPPVPMTSDSSSLPPLPTVADGPAEGPVPPQPSAGPPMKDQR